MSWLITHAEVVIGVALTLVATVFMLQERRTPQSMVAWLLFFIALPYLAVPVFLALGIRKRGRRHPLVALSRGRAMPSLEAGPAATFRAFGLPPALDGHRLELISDGQDAFDQMTRLVRAARSELDVVFYLIANDRVGEAFIEALTDRVRDGVKVRLMVDRLGGFWHPRRAMKAFERAGGKLHWFSPLVALPSKGHLNLRNHRKMIIADGRTVFAGGMNVGAEYMGPDAAPRWSDLSYLLEGPAVAVHRDVFLSDWAGERPGPAPSDPPVEPAGETIAQLIPSGPDMRRDALHDGLVQAIHAAETRVWLATPYFLPTEFLTQALSTAAARGVDVRIIVPRFSNHRVADFARGAYLRELGAAGCRVLLHEGGMLHAKAGLIDDAGWIGSANFDVRSMLLNFEMALFIYDGESVARLAVWFADCESLCRPASPEAGPVRRVVEGIFRLGSPVL